MCKARWRLCFSDLSSETPPLASCTLLEWPPCVPADQRGNCGHDPIAGSQATDAIITAVAPLAVTEIISGAAPRTRTAMIAVQPRRRSARPAADLLRLEWQSLPFVRPNRGRSLLRERLIGEPPPRFPRLLGRQRSPCL